MNFRLPNIFCRGLRREPELLIEACIATGKTADLQAALSDYRKLNSAEVDQLVSVFVEQGSFERARAAAMDFGKRELHTVEYLGLYETNLSRDDETRHKIVAGTCDADIGAAWLAEYSFRRLKIEPIRGYNRHVRYCSLESGGGQITEWCGESDSEYSTRITDAMKSFLDRVRAVTLVENSPAGIACMETIIAARYGSCAHLYEAAQALRVVEWFARWLTARNPTQGRIAKSYREDKLRAKKVCMQIVFENTLPRKVVERLFQECFNWTYLPPGNYWDEMTKTFRRALESGVLSPTFVEAWVMRYYNAWDLRLQTAAAIGLSHEIQRKMQNLRADEHYASISKEVRVGNLANALRIAQRVPLTRPVQLEALITAAIERGEGEIAFSAAKLHHRKLTHAELAQLACSIQKTPVS